MALTKITRSLLDTGISDSSDATAIIIDSGELVGIGQTPVTNDGAVLQITGNDGIQLKRSGQTNGFLLRPGASTDGLRFSQANVGDRMVIDGEGNIAIGGGAASNFSGYVTVDLRDSTGGLLDFSEATSGVYARVQGINNNSFQLTNLQNYPLILNTNNTERLRIAGNGRVGIGTTGGNAGLHVGNGDIRCTSAAFANDANSISMSQESGSVGAITARGPDTSTRASMVLTVSRSNGGSGISAIRIENDGKTIVGTDNETSAVGVLEVRDDGADPIFLVHKNSSGASDGMRVRHGRGLSGFTGTGISFRRSDDTQVGSVGIGFSSTGFNTTSDYRLKENVTYTWDATTRLKQLKPARFNFKDDTSDLVDGFLAHEVSSIVPNSVTGEKDAVDSEGNPDYQSIDHSKLVPLLVKTIQELEARITALES
jgi:hypothetical protein